MRSGSILALTALLALAACSDDRYIVVSGGGIIFNYRIAEATAGIVAEVARPLPEGGFVEASFQNPAGGADIVESKPVSPDRRRFTFTTPPLTGIKADTDYAVVVRVLDANGEPVQTVTTSVHSDLDQSILPDAPLTIGPGYARNPAASE
ncbi:MAG: hypothetical protein J0H08_00855 [Rhizobiales bacterium]|nr:hypothetical protein [Hyphomicrobiales bacterium]